VPGAFGGGRRPALGLGRAALDVRYEGAALSRPANDGSPSHAAKSSAVFASSFVISLAFTLRARSMTNSSDTTRRSTLSARAANLEGGPIVPERISRTFDRLVRVAGLPRIRFHDLRHSHATHLIGAGVHAKVVSERLGHASSSFTMDRYGHVLEGLDAQAVTAVAALVDEARTT
jgi:site-specific recombinase XerC